MKKLLPLLLLINLFSNSFYASHVVGGDIGIEWVGQNQYKIRANIYRDDINGIPPVPTDILVGIYEIGTNNQIDVVSVPRISIGIVDLGDECYTPDPSQVRIEEGIFLSSTITIPDNSNGYYLQTEIYARNTLANNLDDNDDYGMTFYCEIPDPALGQNSSPKFNNYPNDAYFCINNTKIFNYDVTDTDGDSLVYTLVPPLQSMSTSGGNFTAAGSGAYPYYPQVPWNVTDGFGINNIVGGATPMSVDVISGDITANTDILGFFTFVLRVEEYRNGVKIGETRRDVQYSSLNCTTGYPPQFLNSIPQMDGTIEIEYDKLFCKDLIFRDINTSDTLFMEVSSEIFDSGAYIPNLTPDHNGEIQYFYNYNGSSWDDTVSIAPNQINQNDNSEWNIGTIAKRFCWTPDCDDISKTFSFETKSYSLGCDGKSQDSIYFNIKVVPPTVGLELIPNVFTPNNDGLNDAFKLKGNTNPCEDELSITIFDRWGKLVFKSDDPTFEWDGKNQSGKDVAAGTYFMLIEGIFGGELIELEKQTISLLR